MDSLGPELTTALAEVLTVYGIQDRYELKLLKGGWNNRVYRLTTETERFALKVYFYSESDPRPRLEHEWAFLNHCQTLNLNGVPKPLARSSSGRLALYSWIDGVSYDSEQALLTATDIQGALDFIQALNQNDSGLTLADPDLLQASEYCSDLGDHLKHLERRFQRLGQIEALSSLHQDLIAVIQTRLLPFWDTILARVCLETQQHPDLLRCLRPSEHCLSPSDFGFHNALKTALGPVFIDFEYAGWDDPAQLVCDFFSQFQIPVPEAHFEAFAQSVSNWYPDPDWQLLRMSLLRPVHDLKWICIALNHFLNHGSQRRSFAAVKPAGDTFSEPENLAVLERQYDKALLLIEKLETRLR